MSQTHGIIGSLTQGQSLADFRDFSTNNMEHYNQPFTEREFDSALTSCNDTAPGPDEIPYAMVKHASVNTRNFILSIINRIWRDSSYPTFWELSIILAFLKPGKDKLLAASYRPIALTSCLCKIMEKMVNVRLVWYLEKKNILSPTAQHFSIIQCATFCHRETFCQS